MWLELSFSFSLELCIVCLVLDISNQCVKLTLARSPMVTIYRHLVTYFLLPSTILGDKAPGWLGCAAYGMRDITREPMWSSEELKNKSKMTLEGLNPTAPPLKRRRFNSEWVEGCEWPKHDNENGVIFCE